MTVKRKVYLAMGFLVLLSIFAGVLMQSTINKLYVSNKNLYMSSTDSIAMEKFVGGINKLMADMINITYNRRTKDIEPVLVKKTDDAFQEFSSLKPVMEDLIDNPEVLAEVLSVGDRVFASRTDLRNNVTTPEGKTSFEQADREKAAAWIDEVFSAFTDEIQVINEKNTKNFEMEVEKNNVEFDNAKIFTISIFSALILLFLAIAIASKFMVINKLETLVEAVNGVTSGDGDLTKKIGINSSDELGEISTHFNSFTDKVASIIREVKASADETDNSNTAIASTMEELSTTFHNQNVQVATVASAMEEMSSSAMEISATLDSNRELMDGASKLSKEGAKQLDSTLNEIHVIRTKTDKLSVTITSLNESSIQIGEILGVINDIADQTNLLALNAAIEAARAGDAGRGFAVVADEVRKLAERTQRATHEIENIIVSLQNESSTAAKEMNEAGVSVSEGIESLDATKDVISKMLETFEDVQRNVEQMVVAVGQQSAAIEGVNDSAQSIAAEVEECSKVVEEVTKSTIALQEQSANTAKILRQFIVD